MDVIFDRESETFLALLEKYLDDNASIHEVVVQAKKVDLVQQVCDEGILGLLKKRIFTFANEEYRRLIDIDRQIKASNDRTVVDVDPDVFFAQAARISCVREPPYGYERSRAFKPPYPTQEMINRLFEDPHVE
eukprot:jgi/Antlo1/1633/2036